MPNTTKCNKIIKKGVNFMKRVLLLVLSIVLTLGLACPSFGATTLEPTEGLLENDLPASEGWIQPGDIMTPYAGTAATLVFKKTSSTTCKAQAMASRADATKITSKLEVQIKNGSTYNTVANGTATKTVYDEVINHIANFTISSRKDYRLKVSISYVLSGVTRTNYYYTSLLSNGY